jgi:hypothetical protein
MAIDVISVPTVTMEVADITGGPVPAAGRSVDGLTAYLANNATHNLLDYPGVDPTGATDSTAGVLAAAADAESSGRNIIAPPGIYSVHGPLALRNASIIGNGGIAAEGTSAIFRRNGAGDLFVVNGPASLHNVLIDDVSNGLNRPGAAIKYVYQTFGSDVARAGFCVNSRMRITSYNDTAGAWERIVDIDGTAAPDAFGVRDIAFAGCWFFGSRTPDETIRIRKGVHIMFSDCTIVPAPALVRQGITIDINSVSVLFSHMDMIGNLVSHGTQVSYIGGNLGNDSGSNAVFIDSDAVANLIKTTVTNGKVVNKSLSSSVETSGVLSAPTITTTSIGATGTGLKVTNSDSGSAGNMALSADTAEVRIESLNANPMKLNVNGTTVALLDGTAGLTLAKGLFPPNAAGVAQAACRIFAGTGAPSNADGANGDFYHRSDTPGTANQRIYVKSAGAWIGIV